MISTAPEVDRLIDTNAPIVICVSGGKDSQLVAEQVVSHAASANILAILFFVTLTWEMSFGRMLSGNASNSAARKAVNGGANCFVVRGVHHSEALRAETLDGLRSEGYPRLSIPQGKE